MTTGEPVADEFFAAVRVLRRDLRQFASIDALRRQKNVSKKEVKGAVWNSWGRKTTGKPFSYEFNAAQSRVCVSNQKVTDGPIVYELGAVADEICASGWEIDALLYPAVFVSKREKHVCQKENVSSVPIMKKENGIGWRDPYEFTTTLH
ncbi:hypothetical protein Q1695_004246 [Nippostrongylus brasiliensis]|nr:hypothetical protein Q1695_004246 [Nippostrongylus brasiliensis]